MNNSNFNSTGILPNYLNISSSDSKYLFGDNTSTEFNQSSVLKNNYFVYYENNGFPLQQQEDHKDKRRHITGL